jgi:hypothetical protein
VACNSLKVKLKEWGRRGESQVLGDLSRAQSRGTPFREALPPEDYTRISLRCFRHSSQSYFVYSFSVASSRLTASKKLRISRGETFLEKNPPSR